MNIQQCLRSLVAVLLVLSPGVGSAVEPSALQESIDTVVGQVKPSLVRIYVISTEYWEGRAYKERSSGSGVIISADGYVVTNHHVAGHATRLICTLSNREEIEAELVGTDPLTDIAIIKLLPKDGRSFPVVPFGDSDAVRVGDQVLAMGSPMALSQSVTLGIVSNTELVMPRRMGFGDFLLDGEDVGSLVRWIAHDAFIYGGNSGGPLIDMKGAIIGINEISIALAGAIPGNLVEDVAQSIIETGSVKRSWLGLTVQPMLKHSGVDAGALITGAVAGSPADGAGIRSGDILLALNDVPVQVRFEEDLPPFNAMLVNLPIGKAVPIRVVRDGVEKLLTVTPVLRESRLSRESELKEWGIAAQDISFMMAKELKLPNQKGVYVSSTRPGGPGGDAKPSIRKGDIITRVGDASITTVESLRAVTKTLLAGQEDPVPVLTTIYRKSIALVTVVKIGLRELNDPGLEVKKAWLPIQTQVLTRAIARAMEKPDRTGFRVTHIYPNSTAADAGLLKGDIIYAVDGEVLTANAPEHYEELPVLIRNYRVGSKVSLSVDRDDAEMTIEVELIRSPKLEREMRKYRNDVFEFTVRDITFFDSSDEQWSDDQQGVLVTDLKPGGWADIGMLRSGDLVQAVDETPVATIDTLREMMEGIADEQPDSIVFKVLRGIYTVYIELEPKWG